MEAIDEFGEVTDPAIIDRLGNLVLVEKPINASLGNKPYSKKRIVYPQSKILLVHAISERPKIGLNTSIDRAVKGFEPFATWTADSVISRQTKLAEMAREIWSVPRSRGDGRHHEPQPIVG